MDFSEGNGNGWKVLNRLSFSPDGKVASKVLLWMLRLSSFELKTNIVETNFADMLSWILLYELESERVKAFDLLLNLGGHGIINALRDVTNGYTVLHKTMTYQSRLKNVSVLVARGPDLHPRGFDTDCTPFEESPTSLAMYSARVFSNWLHALASVDV